MAIEAKWGGVSFNVFIASYITLFRKPKKQISNTFS